MSKIIAVQFTNNEISVEGGQLSGFTSREYEYFLVRDENVKVGDLAVVPARGFLKIVRVSRILAVSAKANTFAITTFNLEEYHLGIQRAKDIQSLEAQIDVHVEQAKKRQKLVELASTDETLAAMLAQLKALQEV